MARLPISPVSGRARPGRARRRFAELHPRGKGGRFISKAAPPPTERARKPTGEFAQVQPELPLNYETKVKVVLDTSKEDDLEYAEYSVWIVTTYDPITNQERFLEMVQAIRWQLMEEDSHVRWLSIHGTHRTYKPEGFEIREEPD